MIKAIIIDDEQHCIDRLTYLLEECHRDCVQILATCHTAEEAVKQIRSWVPDLIFLDVQLSRQNGFEILKQFPDLSFAVIFITGHEQYAVQAFRFSAFDYLMKPVDPDQLSNTLRKLTNHFNLQERNQKMDTLLYNLTNREKNNKRICIPTAEGFSFEETQNIVRCEAKANYTVIHFQDKKTLTVARTLRGFEELLEDCNFFRVHNSHLINLRYIKSYKRGKGGTILLTDGTQIEVSIRRKEAFLKKVAGAA